MRQKASSEISVGCGILVFIALVVGIFVVSVEVVRPLFPPPATPQSDYAVYREIFLECIADETFTRSECLTLAGAQVRYTHRNR